AVVRLAYAADRPRSPGPPPNARRPLAQRPTSWAVAPSRLRAGATRGATPIEPMTDTSTAPAPARALEEALADPAAAWPDVVLRPHQIEALDQLSGRLAHGSTRTWVDAPTGSGKTVTFCALAAALDGSALILVPRRNLAEQTAAGLARHFPSVS